jgi:segregation and condensation protein A
MHVEEKTIPWWRRALNFALGGIRSGFGLFSRPSTTESIPEEKKISETPKETLEETTALTQAPQPEVIAPAKTLPVELAAEPKPAATAEEAPLAAPVLPVHPTAPLDPVAAVPELVAVSEAVADEELKAVKEQEAEPVALDAAIDEVVAEAAPKPFEEDKAIVEPEPEVAAEPEDKAVVEVAPEIVTEAEPEAVENAASAILEDAVTEPIEENDERAESVPEFEETPEAVIVNEPDQEPIESAETIVEAEIEREGAAEPIAEVDTDAEEEAAVEEIAEADAMNEEDGKPIAEMKPVVEEELEAAETTAEFVNEPAAEPVEVAETIVEEEAVNEVVEEQLQELKTVAEVEPEVVIITEVEAVNEAVAEPIETHEAVEEAKLEAAVEPTSAPEPAPDGVLPLVLKAPPTAEEAAAEKAEEKAAAKLAARQKKLDESSEQSPFSVFVGQVYDGPLDLLLDLIRKQDIDIYDIPIAKITAQFLAYVNQLKAGDMDVAGEFIYTASLLIHIKSKMLLPRMETGQEDAAEDPRRELVERLLEHERFKNAAQMLQQKQMLEAATWTNPGQREFKGDEATEPEIAADTVDLVRIFRDILERARKRPAFNVEEDSVTVGQMIQFLGRRLAMEDKPVALRRLLSHTHSERALIAMFLALLELVRMQAILLRQDRAFCEIFIKKHTGFDAMISEGLPQAGDDWR